MSSTIYFSQPAIEREAIINTPFHQDMIKTAFGNRKETERFWRYKGIDKFHIIKLLYFITRKHFLLRTLNYILFKIESQKISRVHYVPPSVQMDSSSGCLLECPGCLVGIRNSKLESQPLKVTSMSVYKKVIDSISKKSFQLYFHLHAEPLLNKHVFEAIKYADSRGLWTGIHSNLVPEVKDLPKKIIESGLKNLIVSIDGATQSVYEKYRKGGNIEYVFEHISEIIKHRTLAKTQYPWISAKFIVFEHNWHEIKLFKERASQIGIDECIFIGGFSNGIYETGKPATEMVFNLDELLWEKYPLPKVCPFIWDDLRIDIDGGMFPCGNGYQEIHKFYKIKEASKTSMIKKFNASDFIKMRAYFLKKQYLSTIEMPKPCNECAISINFQRFYKNTDGA